VEPTSGEVGRISTWSGPRPSAAGSAFKSAQNSCAVARYMSGEHGIGMARRKPAAGVGWPRLHQHRPPAVNAAYLRSSPRW
jgi:hypothetical protein